MVIIYVVTDMRLSPTQQQMTAVYPHSQGGFMIIDFHTHTFPDELADRAVGTLAIAEEYTIILMAEYIFLQIQ